MMKTTAPPKGKTVPTQSASDSNRLPLWVVFIVVMLQCMGALLLRPIQLLRGGGWRKRGAVPQPIANANTVSRGAAAGCKVLTAALLLIAGFAPQTASAQQQVLLIANCPTTVFHDPYRNYTDGFTLGVATCDSTAGILNVTPPQSAGDRGNGFVQCTGPVNSGPVFTTSTAISVTPHTNYTIQLPFWLPVWSWFANPDSGLQPFIPELVINGNAVSMNWPAPRGFFQVDAFTTVLGTWNSGSATQISSWGINDLTNTNCAGGFAVRAVGDTPQITTVKTLSSINGITTGVGPSSVVKGERDGRCVGYDQLLGDGERDACSRCDQHRQYGDSYHRHL